jgi:transposase-like protein
MSAGGQVLQDAAEDILTFLPFPPDRGRPIAFPNPLARLNREIARRTGWAYLPHHAPARRGGAHGTA